VKLAVRKLAARLPGSWRRQLRFWHTQRKINSGRFRSEEPEYDLLPGLLREGEWAIDIGANLGHYTARLSELVGPSGRVFAFEPVLETFAILSRNALLLRQGNVTLFNIAASDRVRVVDINIPKYQDGLTNFYQARIGGYCEENSIRSFAMPIDGLSIENKVSLIKIDAEGHERAVLMGMHALLRRDKPILILETADAELESEIASMGYDIERMDSSPNLLCRPSDY